MLDKNRIGHGEQTPTITHRLTVKVFGLRSLITFFLSLFIFSGILYLKYIPIRTAAGDSAGTVYTWVDKNNNGIPDDGEPPLQGVCVWNGRRYPGNSLLGFSPSTLSEIQNYCSEKFFQTDADGKWSRWMPGAYTEDVYLFAVSPDGYQPTTNLGVHNVRANFGFVPKGTQPEKKVVTALDYINNQIMIDRITNVLIFIAVAFFSAWLSTKLITYSDL